MAKDTADLDFHLMQRVGIPRERRPEDQGDVRQPDGTVVVSVDNHYSVLEDIWWEKFPAGIKDRAPRVVHQEGVYNIVVNGRSIIPAVSAPTFATFEMAPGYPHPESTFGYSWTAMKQVVDAGVSDADVRKILGGNAIEVFKL